MPELIANGVQIHYDEHGSGAPAIFIHGGFGGPQSTLVPTPNAVTRAVPEGVRLVTYDRRCAGLSQYALEPYSLEDLAADARALLDALGIERSIVIGSSMGGMVALQYALAYPEAVDALALLNTGPNLMGTTPWGERCARAAERARREGDRAAFERTRATLRDPPPPPEASRPPEVAKRLREARALYLDRLRDVSDDDLFTYSTGTLRNYAAFVGYDFTPRLAELRMPTVVIHGTADATVPYAFGETLARDIPGAELHAIDGAVHGILQYPAARAALREWLGRTAGV